ncbi:MAG: DUF1192 domain-containing protein [Hyphomicrobiales bacterium]|nr:DUF1192 domain-containing protein [Hyphomicrobiales bacterium]
MSLEDDRPKKPKTHTLGADLSAYSVYELESYLQALETEKQRVSALMEAKKASRDAADSIFKS